MHFLKLETEVREFDLKFALVYDPIRHAQPVPQSDRVTQCSRDSQQMLFAA